jgi:hypothetical protein
MQLLLFEDRDAPAPACPACSSPSRARGRHGAVDRCTGFDWGLLWKCHNPGHVTQPGKKEGRSPARPGPSVIRSRSLDQATSRRSPGGRETISSRVVHALVMVPLPIVPDRFDVSLSSGSVANNQAIILTFSKQYTSGILIDVFSVDLRPHRHPSDSATESFERR